MRFHCIYISMGIKDTFDDILALALEAFFRTVCALCCIKHTAVIYWMHMQAQVAANHATLMHRRSESIWLYWHQSISHLTMYTIQLVMAYMVEWMYGYGLNPWYRMPYLFLANIFIFSWMCICHVRKAFRAKGSTTVHVVNAASGATVDWVLISLDWN